VTRSWWHENRFWLPAVPFALAGLLLASSYNVREYWYDNGLHHEQATADQGSFVSVTDHYDDTLGPTSRTFSVRLAGLEPTDVYTVDDEPAPPPEGVDAVVVHLDWKAEADQVLRACHVSLVDDEGRRYDVAGATRLYACTPEDHAGPNYPFSDTDVRGTVPEGEDRPATWSTAPVVLVPHDREITHALVWWEPPDYVQLSAS